MIPILQTVSEDIPRLYTGLAEVIAVAIFIFLLPRKFETKKTVVILSVWGVIHCAFLVITAKVYIIFWIPCMIIAAAGMFLMFHILLTPGTIYHFYFTMWAFITAEFAASLEWQIESFFVPDYDSFRRTVSGLGVKTDGILAGSDIGLYYINRLVILVAIYAIVFFILYRMEASLLRTEHSVELTIRDLISTALIVLATFSFSNMSFFIRRSPFSARLSEDVSNIRTIIDLGGIAIMYAFQSRLSEMSREREVSTLNGVLKAQYENYRNYQETIDLINFKYHDLKHQLIGLMAEDDQEKRMESLMAMREELEEYRPERQTGSNVLDTIIASKMMRCKKAGIELTCVADGSILTQMPVTDICSIFGNALDNAIEYETMVSDPARRMIYLGVMQKKGFIYIEVRNYCEEKIRLKNGMPVTTKSDTGIHGYGVKSIAYVVQKNNGSIHFEQRDDEFGMKILIPMD